MAVLAPLRELDEVAYLRFARVYRAFDDLEDFESEIALLRPSTSSRDRRCEDDRKSPLEVRREGPPYRTFLSVQTC